MHHPRHSRIIRAFRVAALLLLLKRLMFAGGVVCLLVSVSKQHHPLAINGLILLGFAMVAGIFQRICAAIAKCPLCLMPPLGRSGCAKHRRASKWLGSRRLPVALSILFLGKLHCPYCHEPIELTLKYPERGR